MSGLPLDVDAAQRRALAEGALALIERRLQRVEARAPIFTAAPPATVDDMLRAPPEQGAAIDAVLARLAAAADGGWSKLHGGDLGYIPSGGLYSGAVAAWLASALHAFTGAAFESPALVALEESVLRWLAGVFGLPAASEGLLLSGGSLANQTALVCARERRGFDASRSVAYLSQRAHHSLHKALHLIGVPRRCVRDVPTGRGTRIDVDALRAQMERDVRDGRVPWLVVGTAGSTDTGAVDDLQALADVAAAHGAWYHVDAAYGGLFMLTQRGRARLAGMERADSVTVDAHKGLALPYGVAALLVREPGALARAHAADEGDYLRDVPRGPAELPHYFERGPELTRPFRGLLAWLPLQLHGVAAFREALDTALDLAAHAAQGLRDIDGVDLLEPPELSIVAFAARAGDAATERIVEVLNGSGRFKVSTTTLDGRTVVRLAILNPRTARADVDGVLDLVRRALG